MTRAECQGVIWVCYCCYASHCNGECCEDELHTREPLSAIPEGFTVTAGMVEEEHNERCTEEVRLNDGCDCETREFSWSSCEGCGSHLGGSRHALTLWKEPERQESI